MVERIILRQATPAPVGPRPIGPAVEEPLKRLIDFHKRCKSAGGTPVYKTKFGGPLAPGELIMACMFKGGKVKGGKITGVPIDLWNRIKRAVEEGKGKTGQIAEEWLREHGYM